MGQKGQAIRPEVTNISSFIKKEREQDVEELTEEEKTLANGARHAFWLTLKKHIEKQVAELDKISEVAIESGMTLEDIGRNTIVISQVKGVINKIFNVVEDAFEARENAKRE